MAVTYVSKGAVVSGFGVTSIAPPLPPGVVEGDVLLAVIFGYSFDVGTPAIAWPAGWTEIDQQNWKPSVTEINSAVAYRVATGADVAPVLSWTGAPTTSAQVFKFTGVDEGSFSGAISFNTGEVNPHTSPAVVTTSDDSKVLYIDMGYQTTPVLVNPTGWTALSSDNGTYLQINLGEKDIPTAGTSSGAISTTGSSSIAWIQWQLEVKKAAVTGTSALTFAAINAAGTGITDSLGGSAVGLLPIIAIGYAYSGNSSDVVYPLVVAGGTALPGTVGTSDQVFLPVVALGAGVSVTIHTLTAESGLVLSNSTAAAWSLLAASAWQISHSAAAPTVFWEVVTSNMHVPSTGANVRTVEATVTASILIDGTVVGRAEYHVVAESVAQILSTAQYLQAYWDGWAFNLNTNAASFYENFKFNSFARIGAQYYGCDDTGIHLLGGDLDGTSQIDAVINTGVSNLSTEFFDGSIIKRVPHVYLSARSPKPMLMVCRVEGREATYRFRVGKTVLAPARADPGKGLEGTFWQFELRNVDGSDFDIDSLAVLPVGTSRRV